MSENNSQSNITDNIDFSSNNNNNTNSSSTSEENSNNNSPRQQTQSSPFECNICFDEVTEPVVTQCGHLFCWTCIFQWLQHNTSQQCPVCKAPVSKEKVIPIYGRGGNGDDPRKKSESIPQRPPGRPEQPRPRNRGDGSGVGGFNDFFSSPFGSSGGINGNVGGSGVSFSAGFGLFPGLFGVHFYGNNNNNNNNNNNSNNPQQRNSMTSEESIFFSRLMFALGLLLLFFVLFN